MSVQASNYTDTRPTERNTTDAQPSVSISIPTLNSAKTLSRCLEAVRAQTYGRIDVNIVDGGSSDETVDIAKAYGVTDIFAYYGGLLGAREIGARKARGSVIVLLDSDQILEPDAIERAVAMLCNYDMLVLEEDVYSNRTFIEKLFECDRKLVHAVRDFSPYTGVMLPRVYKRDILHDAFSAMPVRL